MCYEERVLLQFAFQNAVFLCSNPLPFRIRSISVRYPFCICYVSILYPFRSLSRTRSVSVLYPFAFAFPVRFLLSATVSSEKRNQRCLPVGQARIRKSQPDKSFHQPRAIGQHFRRALRWDANSLSARMLHLLHQFVPDLYSVTLFPPTSSNTAYSFDKILQF